MAMPVSLCMSATFPKREGIQAPPGHCQYEFMSRALASRTANTADDEAGSTLIMSPKSTNAQRHDRGEAD